MNKREKTYIEERVKQFRRWAEEERKDARKATHSQERDEHHHQADLNDCAANTLENLLSDLARIEGKV